MNIQKMLILFVLFSFLLIIPGAMGAVKTFQVQETDLVTISPEALDPDNDQITYSYSPPLDKNGQWQTGYEDAGEYLLKIVASDGISQTTKEVKLIVENKNQPPYLKEKKVVIKELQTLDLKQFVVDPDNDVLEYVFTRPFDQSGLWVPEYDDQGNFVAKFSILDGEYTVPARIEIEVLNTNQPPTVISSFSDQDEVSVKENQAFSFYAEAVDGDDDPVSYSWTINGQNIASKNKGEYFFNFESAGEYELLLRVTDGNYDLEQKWQVTVENVNRKPEVELSPLTVKEGEVITLQLPEKDIDGDTLTYTFDEQFDSSGNWQTTSEDAGEYKIHYYISDGTEKVKEKLEVTILNVDRAPELRLPDKLEVHEGENLSFVVNASDADGDVLNISFLNAPEGALFDKETNTFTWSPGYDYIKRRGGMLSNILNALRLEQRLLRQKKELLEVTVCSQDLCSTGEVPVLIYNSNQVPVLKVPSTLMVTEAEVLQLEPSAYDPDGDIVRYYFTEPVHKRKGQWETAYEDAGEYTIYVTATDGFSPQTLPVIVKVLQKNRQPAVIVPHDEYVLLEGEEFVLPIEVFDDDNDSLSVSVENLPKGASFRNNTLVWKPDYSFAAGIPETSTTSSLSEISFLNKQSDSQQERWISFVVSDKEFDVNHPVKLIVKNVNQIPVISSFAPTEEVVLRPGQPFNFSVNVFDTDGGNLTYIWTFEPGTDIVTGSNLVERTFVTASEKKISVVVSDGESEVSHQWKAIVKEEFVPDAKVIALEEPKFKVYVIEY
ncbi:MAG: hypothetical protein AABX24_05170 [Nanoarchaeota archaeon]